jgi:2,5-diketo-D-gluconate reductase A
MTSMSAIEIAPVHGKTPMQTVLRRHIQLSNIVCSRSVTHFEILDFEITDSEMARISVPNRDQRTGSDPDTFAVVPGQ